MLVDLAIRSFSAIGIRLGTLLSAEKYKARDNWSSLKSLLTSYTKYRLDHN